MAVTREFVQVTCIKDEKNFALCSNLGLMDNPADGVTFEEADAILKSMAEEYAAKGYTVTWTREPLSELEKEFFC